MLPARDQVLICHSPSTVDLRWRERLRTHLDLYEKRGVFSIWDFTAIRPGEKRHEAIAAALSRARVAVVLVTPDLLASDFIAETALPTLLEAAQREGVKILWAAVRPSLVKDSPLWRYQAVTNPKRSLARMRGTEPDEVLVHICEEIVREYLRSSETAEIKTTEDHAMAASISKKEDVGIGSLFHRNSINSRTFAIINTAIGLALLPVAAIFAKLTASNNSKLFLYIGAIGGCYLLLAIFFENISIFPKRHRLRAFGLLLTAFILLTLIVVARAAGYYYQARKERRLLPSPSPISNPQRSQLSTPVAMMDMANLPDMRNEDIAHVADAGDLTPSSTTGKPSDVSEMAMIPKGVFMMGGNEGSNVPPHKQEVAEFLLDKTEVTVRQYRQCIQAGACEAQSTVTPGVLFTDTTSNRTYFSNDCNLNGRDYDKHPMNCVDFFQATNYCKWVGKRLPKEAEWEYAVRGPDNMEHPWGSSPDHKRLCWCYWGRLEKLGIFNISKRGTCPVGSVDDKTKQEVHGLAGNVSEWVDGWYCEHGYLGSCAKKERVFRGGNYFGEDSCHGLEGNLRFGTLPQTRAPWIGFRCAKSPTKMIIEPEGSTSLRTPTVPKPNPDMALIPAGTFKMGSGDPDPWQEPVHEVTVAEFWLDKTEVTVATYRACVQAGICLKPGSLKGCNWGRKGHENHPINCVSFYQAKTLCKWLDRRLPKQSEWEYAARGKESFIYPWGNDQPQSGLVCWQRSATCEVSSSPMDKTSAGVMDLAGNVAEWLDDSGCGIAEENVRGGGYLFTKPKELRASHRWCPAAATSREGDSYIDVGFRCAK